MESASVPPRNGTFRVISVNAMTETVTNMMVSFAQVQYRLTLNCFGKQTELMGIMLDKAQLLLSPLMEAAHLLIIQTCYNCFFMQCNDQLKVSAAVKSLSMNLNK